jgi:hypothetical protein
MKIKVISVRRNIFLQGYNTKENKVIKYALLKKKAK